MNASGEALALAGLSGELLRGHAQSRAGAAGAGRRARRVEVCIVGAGFTGLSAAIELAERGHKVVVLEGRQGRLGGLGPERRADRQRPERRPRDHRAALRRRRRRASSPGVAQEGGRIIRERVARYGIACDLKEGNLFAALTPRQVRELEAKQALWRRHGHRQLRDARPRRARGGTSAATPMPAECSTEAAGTSTR